MSVVVGAETAVKVETCSDAWYKMVANAFCIMTGSQMCYVTNPAPTSRCWDFEGGLGDNGFGGWQIGTAANIGLVVRPPLSVFDTNNAVVGTAFNSQPTYGDNVSAERALKGQYSPLGGTVLASIAAIGGDYWQTSYPIGHEGNKWLGTYENRQNAQTAWSSVQGDGPTGTLISPQFLVNRNYVTFLISGGNAMDLVYVELQEFVPAVADHWVPEVPGYWKFQIGTTECVNTPRGYKCTTLPSGQVWVPPVPGYWTGGNPAYWKGRATASGSRSELLERKVFLTNNATGLQGKTARLVIVDNSTLEWGHINVDHVLHTDTFPNDLNGANQPVWGFADTHAHMGNHTAFKSLGQRQSDGTSKFYNDGYAFHGTPGVDNSSRAWLAMSLPSCDSAGHGTPHAGAAVIGAAESLMTFGTTFPIPLTNHWGAGVTPGGTGPDLWGWPYWYTRLHQQMHVTWVKRAYQGGQRLMVASAGNGEIIGMLMRGNESHDFLSDYGALRRFANYMTDLASQNSTWMEIALTPQDARRIIRQNKLAIVLAAEVEDIGDHCAGKFSRAVDEAEDHSTTTTTQAGLDPFNQQKHTDAARSCKTAGEWEARVDKLHEIGYRVVMLAHFTNNDLAGPAVYGDFFSLMNTFNNGHPYIVKTSKEVGFKLDSDLYNLEAAWTNWWGSLTHSVAVKSALQLKGLDLWSLSLPNRTPFVTVRSVLNAIPYEAGKGHINTVGLLPNGAVVINRMKKLGMIFDLAHLGQDAREKVLGLGSNSLTSPLASPAGCDMNLESCRTAAYPAISSHAGLREMSEEGASNENGLRLDMIERIRDIGGTIAVGTSAGEMKGTDAATGSQDPQTKTDWSGIYQQNVANSCGGSSRTFAQGYLYAVRTMQGQGGITLGTDINGLEAQLNPRFGTMGCFERGNLPWVLQYSAGSPSTTLLDRFAPNNAASMQPFKYNAGILKHAGPTAGAQRWEEHLSATGLNYSHYKGTPPSGGQFVGLWEPNNYAEDLRNGKRLGSFGWVSQNSMSGLSALPAINASVTGNRVFDYNYDGLAQYGMLPDMLQDTRGVGMTKDQLAPLFRGAEALIKTWEKGCAQTNLTDSFRGC